MGERSIDSFEGRMQMIGPVKEGVQEGASESEAGSDGGKQSSLNSWKNTNQHDQHQGHGGTGKIKSHITI